MWINTRVSRGKNRRQVMHVHLALTDDPSSMRVSWVTGEASRAPAVRSRMVSRNLGKGQEQEAWQVSLWIGFSAVLLIRQSSVACLLYDVSGIVVR